MSTRKNRNDTVVADEQEIALSTGGSPEESYQPTDAQAVIRQLTDALRETKGLAKDTVEEYEAAIRKFQASCEELVSANQALRTEIEELAGSKADLQNLMAATEIGTIFLNRNLHIMRFTPPVTQLFDISSKDIGRPLAHFTHKLGYPQLIEDAQPVLDRLVPIEREVQSQAGRWYLARMRPYRTVEDKIDGVVVSFIDISGQKQMQQDLEEAQSFAENLVNTIREPLMVLDLGLRVISANQAFYETFGMRPEMTIGHLIYELDDGKWAMPRLRELLEQILPEDGAFNDLEIENTFGQRGRRTMLLNARCIETRQLILLAIEDVTLRKEAEQQAVKEKNLAQLYLDVAGVIMVALDRNGCVTMINRAGCEVLGWSEGMILGKDWFAHFLPERNRGPVRKIFEALMKGEVEASEHYENAVLTQTGEERIILWHNAVVRNEEGTVIGTLGSGTDITERKKAEQAFATSRRQLRAIFDNALDAFLLADDDGRYVDCNPAACALLGYEREELLRESAASLGSGEHLEPFPKWWQAFLAAGAQQGEYQLRRKDGCLIDAESRSVAHILPGLHLSILRDVSEQKQREKALRESEQRFRSTFEQAAVGFAHVAQDGTWLRVNGRLCEIVGYSRDELLQMKFEDITHPDDVAADWEQAHRAWAGEIKSYTMEKRYRRKDGASVWVNLTGSVVREPGPAGRPLYFTAIIEDISARKQVEDALRQSEHRFRNLFEASPDAIFVEDLQGNVLDVNEAACRLHRSERDALIGMNVHELVPPDRRKDVMENLGKLISGEVSFLQAYSWTVQQQAIPVEIHANRFVYNGRGAVLLHVRDISGRIATEAALTESQARARAILDTTVDAVITIDERGLIESANPATVQLFGYREEEMLGRNVSMLMPSPYHDEHDQYLRHYLETGIKKIIGSGREVTALRKDGSTFPIDLAVSEVHLSDRRIFTGFIHDISERRRLEQEVLRISEEERQRIGQDIHDGLASQFSGIALLSRGLVNRLAKAQPIHPEMLEDVAQQARNGAEQARALARGLNPVKLDREGLQAALKELVHSAETLSGIACSYDVDETLPSLASSVTIQLYRIAQEAVTNAIRHADAAHLQLRLRREGACLLLSVRDDGAGLLDQSPQAGGMGLHIMPYRARLIGATLNIDSAPGKGTCVTCTLPLAEALPEMPSAQSPSLPHPHPASTS